MLNQVRAYRNRGERVVVITEQVERLENLWYEQDASARIPTVETISEAPPAASMRFLRGAAAEGWSVDSEAGRLHFITDAEIFGWTRPEPRRRRESTARRARRAPDTTYTDWDEGTYVVHVDYGIGRFSGLRHRTVNQTEREYLLVEYQGADTIYVPIHQADRLSRYVGAEETPPKLNQLGKPDQWIKARDKARRNAEEEAKELLQIYSRRASATGYAFSPDSAWQHEMEAGFPFVETEDQLRVIREVKADMLARKPMDRLICGDVGFGKTEVALRAAFKAVQDGAQVAVLVPTNGAGAAALRKLQSAPRRLSGDNRNALALPHQRAAGGDRRAARIGRGRHRHRHASPALEGHPLQESRLDDHRRGAALWRQAQGALQEAARPHRHPDADRHADTAHALPEFERHPRYQHDSDAAGRPPARDHAGRRLGRQALPPRHHARIGARRAGLRRAQSRPLDSHHPQPYRAHRARSFDRRSARADAAANIGTGHVRLFARRIRYPDLDFHHRKRDRYAARQYADRRPR